MEILSLLPGPQGVAGGVSLTNPNTFTALQTFNGNIAMAPSNTAKTQGIIFQNAVPLLSTYQNFPGHSGITAGHPCCLYIGDCGNYNASNDSDTIICIGGNDQENDDQTRSYRNGSSLLHTTECIFIGYGPSAGITNASLCNVLGNASYETEVNSSGDNIFGSNSHSSAIQSNDNSGIGNACLANAAGPLNNAVQGNSWIGSLVFQNLSFAGDESFNLSLGYLSGALLRGSHNTFVGNFTGGTATSTIHNAVCLGEYAGAYLNADNRFYVNNQDRINTAGDDSLSLMAGTFAATAASQLLTINAVVTHSVDRGTLFINQTSAAASSVATLTNSPVAGNPGFWLKIKINGSNYTVPAWAA